MGRPLTPEPTLWESGDGARCLLEHLLHTRLGLLSTQVRLGAVCALQGACLHANMPG